MSGAGWGNSVRSCQTKAYYFGAHSCGTMLRSSLRAAFTNSIGLFLLGVAVAWLELRQTIGTARAFETGLPLLVLPYALIIVVGTVAATRVRSDASRVGSVVDALTTPRPTRIRSTVADAIRSNPSADVAAPTDASQVGDTGEDRGSAPAVAAAVGLAAFGLVVARLFLVDSSVTELLVATSVAEGLVVAGSGAGVLLARRGELGAALALVGGLYMSAIGIYIGTYEYLLPPVASWLAPSVLEAALRFAPYAVVAVGAVGLFAGDERTDESNNAWLFAAGGAFLVQFGWVGVEGVTVSSPLTNPTFLRWALANAFVAGATVGALSMAVAVLRARDPSV